MNMNNHMDNMNSLNLAYCKLLFWRSLHVDIQIQLLCDRHMPGYPKIDRNNDTLLARYDGAVIDALPWVKCQQAADEAAHAHEAVQSSSGSAPTHIRQLPLWQVQLEVSLFPTGRLLYTASVHGNHDAWCQSLASCAVAGVSCVPHVI